MSNEYLPPPEDELSDEQLTHVSGASTDTLQPTSTPQLTADTPAETQMVIEKIEIANEKIERVLR
jgi:hypothetical protein